MKGDCLLPTSTEICIFIIEGEMKMVSRSSLNIFILMLVVGIILISIGIFFMGLGGWSGWDYYLYGLIPTIFGGVLIVLDLIGGIYLVVKSRREKREIREGVELKEKSLTLDPNHETVYLMRVEREEIGSGEVLINHICGNCKIKNNLKELERNSEQYQCLSCGAYNYLNR
jgi:hypothetical protein